MGVLGDWSSVSGDWIITGPEQVRKKSLLWEEDVGFSSGNVGSRCPICTQQCLGRLTLEHGCGACREGVYGSLWGGDGEGREHAVLRDKALWGMPRTLSDVLFVSGQDTPGRAAVRLRQSRFSADACLMLCVLSSDRNADTAVHPRLQNCLRKEHPGRRGLFHGQRCGL